MAADEHSTSDFNADLPAGVAHVRDVLAKVRHSAGTGRICQGASVKSTVLSCDLSRS
jgi:hypothetical protein